MRKVSKPKLTDAQRHKRFMAMAREVEASESARSFDIAFSRVTKSAAIRPKKKTKPS